MVEGELKKILKTRKSCDETRVFGSDIDLRCETIPDRVGGKGPTTEQSRRLSDVNPILPLHQNLSPNKSPKMNVGSIRSTSPTRYHFGGLFITEKNVDSLLVLSKELDYGISRSAEDTRRLIESLQRHSELILTTQYALDEMEYM
ncbi:hypothetical protein RRF57_001137 [Xylaria bambusicola]|uniref:Uncharacterized protein n=1 Tax=Xylaria bambusicola TaxID=326684 RepID=A0AAN7UGS9_9PEZI